MGNPSDRSQKPAAKLPFGPLAGVVLVQSLLLSACVVNHGDFELGQDVASIRSMQILDPAATERNRGKVLTLDGTHGILIMTTRREAIATPAEVLESDFGRTRTLN